MEFSSDDKIEEKLIKEIEKIAISTSKEYEDCVIGEKQNARHQIDNFNIQVGQIFAKYVGVVPHNVLNKLREQIEAEVISIINSSRLSERNGTITRLADVRADKVEIMASKVQSFKGEGTTKDDSFEMKMEEIDKRIQIAYQKVLNQKPSRGADMALDEIINEARRLKNAIVTRNEENSRDIEGNLKKRITELEDSLSERKPQTSDIRAKMQSGLNSPDEIATYDQKELEKSNDSIEQPKIDYGAMFK